MEIFHSSSFGGDVQSWILESMCVYVCLMCGDVCLAAQQFYECIWVSLCLSCEVSMCVYINLIDEIQRDKPQWDDLMGLAPFRHVKLHSWVWPVHVAKWGRESLCVSPVCLLCSVYVCLCVSHVWRMSVSRLFRSVTWRTLRYFRNVPSIYDVAKISVAPQITLRDLVTLANVISLFRYDIGASMGITGVHNEELVNSPIAR